MSTNAMSFLTSLSKDSEGLSMMVELSSTEQEGLSIEDRGLAVDVNGLSEEQGGVSIIVKGEANISLFKLSF